MTAIDWDDVIVPRNIPLTLGEDYLGYPCIACDWCYRPVIGLSAEVQSWPMDMGTLAEMLNDHGNRYHRDG